MVINLYDLCQNIWLRIKVDQLRKVGWSFIGKIYALEVESTNQPPTDTDRERTTYF